jgi:hypothetical protein
MSCEHCEANERVKQACQEALYRADKQRVEADQKARDLQAQLDQILDAHRAFDRLVRFASQATIG